MKRLIVAAAVIGTLGIGNAVSAGPPQTPDEQTSVEASRLMPGAMINDIIVPYEVMVYVETKYPGHTVTEAQKVRRESKETYRLRVDSDIYANDRESTFLYYDKEWKLLDEEKRFAPPPKVETKEEPKPEKPDEREDKPDEKPERRDDPRGGGDDGGGNDEDLGLDEEADEGGEDDGSSGSDTSGEG